MIRVNLLSQELIDKHGAETRQPSRSASALLVIGLFVIALGALSVFASV